MAIYSLLSLAKTVKWLFTVNGYKPRNVKMAVYNQLSLGKNTSEKIHSAKQTRTLENLWQWMDCIRVNTITKTRLNKYIVNFTAENTKILR